MSVLWFQLHAVLCEKKNRVYFYGHRNVDQMELPLYRTNVDDTVYKGVEWEA